MRLPSYSSMRFKEHENTVTCMVSASFRGRLYLLTADYDGMIFVWDVTVRRTVQPTMLSSFRASISDKPSECEILSMVAHCDHGSEADACYMTGGNDSLIMVSHTPPRPHAALHAALHLHSSGSRSGLWLTTRCGAPWRATLKPSRASPALATPSSLVRS